MVGNREMDGNREMVSITAERWVGFQGTVVLERWELQMCGNGNRKMGGCKEKGDNRNMGILQYIVDC